MWGFICHWELACSKFQFGEGYSNLLFTQTYIPESCKSSAGLSSEEKCESSGAGSTGIAVLVGVVCCDILLRGAGGT